MATQGKAAANTTRGVNKRKAGEARVDEPSAGWDEGRERDKLKERLSARMIEFLEMSNIPQRGRIAVVANVTHRRPQGVSKWFKPAGALPDTMSIYLFAQTFQASTDYLFGLTPRMRVAQPNADPTATRPGAAGGEAKSDAETLLDIARVLSERMDGNACITMDGDEMEPTIRRNAPVWIDTTRSRIQGNGIYAIAFKGRTTVRAVEDRPGEGISLICDNKRYREQIIGAEGGLERKGIKVIGKVVGWLQTA